MAQAKTKSAIRANQKPKRRTHVWVEKDDRLFTLDVFITDGPMTEAFCKANKEVSRTIELRGDDTLDMLHEAIFTAFDRDDPHMYEFQVGGKGPMDPKARRYVLPSMLEDQWHDETMTGDLTVTTIGSLNLKKGQFFGYWFDFGDDWWHQIEVLSIAAEAPKAKYPKIVSRTGASPPQYPDWDEKK